MCFFQILFIPTFYSAENKRKMRYNNISHFFLAFPANPCPPETPFLCRSPQKTCIALGNICNRHPDCPDGFDEDPQMCNASKSLFCLI